MINQSSIYHKITINENNLIYIFLWRHYKIENMKKYMRNKSESRVKALPIF